jgi:hypothetical protein
MIHIMLNNDRKVRTFTFHLDKVVDAAPDARDEELKRTSMSNTECDNLCASQWFWIVVIWIVVFCVFGLGEGSAWPWWRHAREIEIKALPASLQSV